VRETLSENDDSVGDEQPKERKSKGKISKNNFDDLVGLVASILLLIVAASGMREEVKPNETEINGVSEHIVKIASRHVNIQNKLTGDMLDLFGLIAIFSGWYVRVAPALQQAQPVTEYYTPEVSNVDLSQEPGAMRNAILHERAPGTANFFDQVRYNHGVNNATANNN
jgi:hypothetical protein